MNVAFSEQCQREEPLVQVVFVSTATEPLLMRRVGRLVGSAMHRNKALGITGLLLYANQRFMGAMEGPESAVLGRLSAIRADYRHKNLDVMRFETISERLFSSWQMSTPNIIVGLDLLSAVSPFMDAAYDTSRYENKQNEVYRAMIAFRNAHVSSTARSAIPAR